VAAAITFLVVVVLGKADVSSSSLFARHAIMSSSSTAVVG
jgi:hypothetical protein